MNNFFTHYRHRGFKFVGIEFPVDERVGACGEAKFGEKIRGMTWREFYNELDEVLLEKGLSAERLGGMSSQEANLYLAPAFIGLLRRGYKVYPDLTM